MTQSDIHTHPPPADPAILAARVIAHERFAGIFDRLADGFFVLDREWRFSYLNQAARRALLGDDAFLGRSVWELFPDMRETIFESEFRRAARELASCEFQAFYPGAGIWLRLNVFPFDDGLAVSFADVTLARETELALARVCGELQEQVRAYGEMEAFAHTVAHDIRAPLAAIRGFSQALSESAVNELGPRSAHYLARILNAAGQMDAMTEAIMSLCRLARKEMQVEMVDLSPIARECLLALKEADPTRQATFSVAPCMWAECDAGMMRIALQNLLSNAWKYGGDSEGRLYIELGIELDGDQQMRYFVRDNGAGFHASHAGIVFQPFQRLHGDAFPGEGIGLATVKRVIDRHLGSIWVDSEAGKGCTFRFKLAPDRTGS